MSYEIIKAFHIPDSLFTAAFYFIQHLIHLIGQIFKCHAPAQQQSQRMKILLPLFILFYHKHIKNIVCCENTIKHVMLNCY